MLYTLIAFGVSLDIEHPSPFDPPDHLFRIRLVCTLLETCGQYFSHGLSKVKLDYFFIYFQVKSYELETCTYTLFDSLKLHCALSF